MPAEAEPQYESLFRLFREGHKLESILSGWRLTEARLADILIQGYRSGEKVDPDWILPPRLAGQVKDTIRERTDLTPVQVSSHFNGKVSPHVVRVLKLILGTDRGVDSVILSESSFFERLHDDLHGARSEIMICAPEIKGAHWRKWLEAFRRVILQEGSVAFFSGKVSELIEEDIRKAGIVLIEKHTNANLAVIDGAILWEGSMNILLPPKGEEHVRRTVSRLQCDEVRDIHDLYV